MHHDITNIKENNDKKSHIGSSFLIPLIKEALKGCKRTRIKKNISNTFSANPWYDEECKTTKRKFKGKKENKTIIREDKQLIKSKKEEYVINRRKELIMLGKHNPKDFWRKLQQARK